MNKNTKFHIGDLVQWDGSPNEFRDNRYGYILSIKGKFAYISKFHSDKVRKLPLKILKPKLKE